METINGEHITPITYGPSHMNRVIDTDYYNRRFNDYLNHVNKFGPIEHQMYGIKGLGRFGPEVNDYPEVHVNKGWNRLPVSRRQQLNNWRHNTPEAYLSDTDNDYIDNLLEKKLLAKHMRQYNQWRQHVTEPNWDQIQCTLCWHPIRPLVDTDILDCGHIYHRFCLKELLEIVNKTGKKNVLCCHCKQVVEPTLINKLKTRLNLETTTTKSDDLKKFEI